MEKRTGLRFAIGVGTLAVILLFKHFTRFPGILVAVAGATVVVALLDLERRADLSVLGPLPQGLPTFAIPWISYGDVVPVLIGGGAVAVISFADTSVLSRTYAARLGANVDPNQEMVGLGVANLAAGFFHGFPISSSSSRTPVAEAAGAQTQLTGVVGAVAVALILLLAPTLLQHLPYAALAAVVIASAIGLIEVADLMQIFRIQPWEFWLSMVCFVGVAVFGAIPGIGLAIVVAVLEFLWDGWRPHSAVLGRAEGVKGYHDVTRYPQARQIPGLVLFRWDAPLFFANAEFFKERVLDAVNKALQQVRWVVVAAEPVTSVDVTAADMLADLDKTLGDAGVELRFAELKDPVKDKLKRFGMLAKFGEGKFFPTVGAAVSLLPRTLPRTLGRLGRPLMNRRPSRALDSIRLKSMAASVRGLNQVERQTQAIWPAGEIWRRSILPNDRCCRQLLPRMLPRTLGRLGRPLMNRRPSRAPDSVRLKSMAASVRGLNRVDPI